MNRRIIFALCVLAVFVFGLFLFTRTDKGIEGRWVLEKEIESNGNVLKKAELKSLGVTEEYVITEEKVHYVCQTEQMSKPIEINFELVRNGDGTYHFKKGDLAFVSNVVVKGNKLSYYVGEGDGRTQMIFVRK
jgi:hypothetical protein